MTTALLDTCVLVPSRAIADGREPLDEMMCGMPISRQTVPSAEYSVERPLPG
jgi:hypothetical protein